MTGDLAPHERRAGDGDGGWERARPWVAVLGGVPVAWSVAALTEVASPLAAFVLVPVAFSLALHLPRPGLAAVGLGLLSGVLGLVTLVALIVVTGGNDG